MRHMPKKHWLLDVVGWGVESDSKNQVDSRYRITESAKCPETGTRQARQARLAQAGPRGPCIVLSIDTTTCTMDGH